MAVTRGDEGEILKMPAFVKDGLSCMEVKPAAQADHSRAESMDGVEFASRPPTPPETRAATPRLTILPCPSRLNPAIPPPNFGAVKDGLIFRSAFPADRNVGFLRKLDVRNVLCLVDTQPSAAYGNWIDDAGIRRKRIDIAANKDGKMKTTWESLSEALLYVMDAAHYPLYIHCNQGRHRTGCVVACFRKIRRWSMEDILAEYETYAAPKARTGDIDLIKAFDVDKVFEYAMQHGYFDNRTTMRRMDSTIVNIDMLAEALASVPGDAFSVDWEMMAISNSSAASSENALELRASAMHSRLAMRPIELNEEAVDNEDDGADASYGDRLAHTPPLLQYPIATPTSEATTTTVVEVPGGMLTPPEETGELKSMDSEMASGVVLEDR